MNYYVYKFKERVGYEEILSKRRTMVKPELLDNSSENYKENIEFDIKIALPSNADCKFNRAIFVFHGLNERTWDKYSVWVEELVIKTGVPIIMFPIALHIGRSPVSWSNPREMQLLVERYTQLKGKSENLSFVNFALSSRIKADPHRFYLSGRETIYNVCQFIEEAKSDRVEVLTADVHFDIFSYSIGALLSQVLIMANPNSYFSNSRLFMFCGGSLFGEMNGSSKLIMDKEAFMVLNSYYRGEFLKSTLNGDSPPDEIDMAFLCHIDREFLKEERIKFYKKIRDRVRVISLKNDRVIPTSGIKGALGDVWNECLKEFDFPFEYSHEIPFPCTKRRKEDSENYSLWLDRVFSEASNFFV